MMEGQFMSPTYSIKRKTQCAARRIKNGSPQMLQEFRQRCRQRMHERRNELFFERRLGLIDFSQDETEKKQALAEIFHSEFNNLASMEWNASAITPSNQTESLQKPFTANQHEFNALPVDDSFEIVEEAEEQWLLAEYQKILWEQKEVAALFDNDGVVCPICLKNFMFEIPNYAACNCGLRISTRLGLNQLKQNIQEQVNVHSATCLSKPTFSIFQDGENVSLCIGCTSCDIFALV